MLDQPYVRIDKRRLRATHSLNDDDENNNKGGSGGGGGQLYRILRASHVSEATSVNIYSPSRSLVVGTEERNATVKRRVVVAQLVYLSSNCV